MRNLILFVLCVTPVISIAQINYVVKGNLEKINSPAKIFMIYKEGTTNKIDSAIIKNHMFEFKGVVSDTLTANIVVDYQDVGLDALGKRANLDEIQVYLVNGQTELKSSDSLYEAKVTGNRINEDLAFFNKLILPAMRRMTPNNTEKQFEDAEALRAELSRKYLKENPDSYISLDRALPNIAGGYTDFNEAEPLFMSLSEKVRSTSIGVAYQKMLSALKKTIIGAMAPEFSQTDVN